MPRRRCKYHRCCSSSDYSSDCSSDESCYRKYKSCKKTSRHNEESKCEEHEKRPTCCNNCSRKNKKEKKEKKEKKLKCEKCKKEGKYFFITVN